MSTTTLTSAQVKEKIKSMKHYDINVLSALATKSGVQLMTVNFWYNALKN